MGHISDMTQLARKPFLVLAGILLTVFCIQYLQHDLISMSNGLGADGVAYARIAADLPSAISANEIHSATASRVLLPAIYYTLFKVFNVVPVTNDLVHIFVAGNILFSLLAVWLYCQIAKKLEFCPRTTLNYGFFLFLNFAVLKWSTYDPVLIDTFALFIGFLTLHCYLMASTQGMAICMLIASLSWPSAMIPICGLMIFPYHRDAPQRPILPANSNLLGVLAALAGCFVLYKVWETLALYGGHISTISEGVFDVVMPLVPISALVSALYLAGGLWQLGNDRDFFRPTFYRHALQIRAIGWLIVIFATLVLIRKALGQRDGAEYLLIAKAGHNLELLFATSVVLPMKFVVSHTFFYGPVFLLIALSWKSVAHQFKLHGIGMVILCALAVFHSLASESRHLIFYFPFVGIMAGLALNTRLNQVSSAGALALALLFSRFWLPLGGGPFSTDTRIWANQLFYMNMGPFTSHEMYVAQGMALIAMLVGLKYLFFFRVKHE